MGSPISAVTPVTTDKEIGLLEDELRSEAKHYRKLGRELTSGTGQEISLGLKAAEVSLKFDRAYKEILEERKGREHDIWLVEQNRLLKGDGGS